MPNLQMITRFLLSRSSALRFFQSGFAKPDQLPSALINSIYPPSGTRGTEVELTVKGKYLDDAEALFFSDPSLKAKPKKGGMASLFRTLFSFKYRAIWRPVGTRYPSGEVSSVFPTKNHLSSTTFRKSIWARSRIPWNRPMKSNLAIPRSVTPNLPVTDGCGWP